MSQQDRAVTPVISTILVVAIVVILAATVSVAFLGITENLTEPAPLIADTSGEFVPEDIQNDTDRVVRITHVAGDSIDVEDIEIIVRASGPGDNLPAEVRLVNLPADGFSGICPTDRIQLRNLQGDKLIERGCAPNQVIVDSDSNIWSSGRTIQFEIRSERADFSTTGGPNEANKLEVIIVYTPSNAIVSEHVFRP